MYPIRYKKGWRRERNKSKRGGRNEKRNNKEEKNNILLSTYYVLSTVFGALTIFIPQLYTEAKSLMGKPPSPDSVLPLSTCCLLTTQPPILSLRYSALTPFPKHFLFQTFLSVEIKACLPLLVP